MIASLPMYDRPETARANDALWTRIRAALGYGPLRLDRKRAPWDVWSDPDLVLSQTCGLPFRTRLHKQVTLVGTPDYGIEGAPPGYYRSVFVVRRGDSHDLPAYRARRFAYNDAGSQSGWAAAQTHAMSLGFRFENCLASGAHRASARMVADGRADIAALDAVSWRLMLAHDGFAAGLEVIAASEPTPGLPLISARGRDQAQLFAAVRAGIEALDAASRRALGLRALVHIPAEAYLAVPTPPAP